MNITSNVGSNLLKFTKGEIDFLHNVCGTTDTVIGKGNFWCEDIGITVIKTVDTVTVTKNLSDSGLSVSYSEYDSSVTDVVTHCVDTLHFFKKFTPTKQDEQLKVVYNVFRDNVIYPPHTVVTWTDVL